MINRNVVPFAALTSDHAEAFVTTADGIAHTIEQSLRAGHTVQAIPASAFGGARNRGCYCGYWRFVTSDGRYLRG
jgi:hypothetical protein